VEGGKVKSGPSPDRATVPSAPPGAQAIGYFEVRVPASPPLGDVAQAVGQPERRLDLGRPQLDSGAGAKDADTSLLMDEVAGSNPAPGFGPGSSAVERVVFPSPTLTSVPLHHN
jgi:hypothetical protein